MSDQHNKSIMRNLGEFVGHIVRGVKSKPDRRNRREIRRDVEKEQRGDVTLRRTTIEEIEYRDQRE